MANCIVCGEQGIVAKKHICTACGNQDEIRTYCEKCKTRQQIPREEGVEFLRKGGLDIDQETGIVIIKKICDVCTPKAEKQSIKEVFFLTPENMESVN